MVNLIVVVVVVVVVVVMVNGSRWRWTAHLHVHVHHGGDIKRQKLFAKHNLALCHWTSEAHDEELSIIVKL